MRSVVSLALIALIACGRTAVDAPFASIDGGADGSSGDASTAFPPPTTFDASWPDAAGTPQSVAFTDDASLLAVNAGGVYFTSHSDPSALRYIDSNGAIVSVIALPGTAVSLAIDADTLYAAVTDHGGDSPGTVQAIALASGRMSKFAAVQNITGVAIDDGNVYWSALDASDAGEPTLGTIRRSPKTGGTTTTVVTTTRDAPAPFAVLALDALFYATLGTENQSYPPQYGGSFVLSAPKDAVNAAGKIVASPAKTFGVGGFARVGTTTVILSPRAGIDVVAIDDDGTSRTLSSFKSSASACPYAIVSDGARVFWAEAGEHGMIRAWSPGDVSATTIARDETYPYAVAVYGGRVYWTASTGVWSRAK